jgi:hypothetical protein
MLSAQRIVEIFRRRGGGEFANLTEKLTADQISYLEKMAGGEPIIAMMRSRDEWFALTKSHFVLSRERELCRMPFSNICAVEISGNYRKNLRRFEHIKTTGGDIDVHMQDGRTLQIKVEPGGPYLGLMNVLMRIATLNRRQRTSEASGQNGLPTTNDKRPTTHL